MEKRKVHQHLKGDNMKVTDKDAYKLYVNLHNKGYQKSRNINMSPRRIRACVEKYPHIFISNTANGFKLVSQATAPEIEHSIKDAKSRAHKLLKKCSAWEKESHKKFYPDEPVSRISQIFTP